MLKYLRCYCSKIPELRNLSIFLRGLIIVSSYTFQNHWSRGKRQKSKRTMTSFEEVTKLSQTLHLSCTRNQNIIGHA